jgi:hypothetical protein
MPEVFAADNPYRADRASAGIDDRRNGFSRPTATMTTTDLSFFPIGTSFGQTAGDLPFRCIAADRLVRFAPGRARVVREITTQRPRHRVSLQPLIVPLSTQRFRATTTAPCEE